MRPRVMLVLPALTIAPVQVWDCLMHVQALTTPTPMGQVERRVVRSATLVIIARIMEQNRLVVSVSSVPLARLGAWIVRQGRTAPVVLEAVRAAPKATIAQVVRIASSALLARTVSQMRVPARLAMTVHITVPMMA